jgi:hypothetical protein
MGKRAGSPCVPLRHVSFIGRAAENSLTDLKIAVPAAAGLSRFVEHLA